jgi:hypothetical protein
VPKIELKPINIEIPNLDFNKLGKPPTEAGVPGKIILRGEAAKSKLIQTELTAGKNIKGEKGEIPKGTLIKESEVSKDSIQSLEKLTENDFIAFGCEKSEVLVKQWSEGKKELKHEIAAKPSLEVIKADTVILCRDAVIQAGAYVVAKNLVLEDFKTITISVAGLVSLVAKNLVVAGENILQSVGFYILDTPFAGSDISIEVTDSVTGTGKILVRAQGASASKKLN